MKLGKKYDTTTPHVGGINMSNALMKVMNAMMKPLLRSPVHFLTSGWCMLITVRGRKTGRLYTTPVYYQQEGKVVRFFSGKHLKWVKNLDGGAVVTLRLRGNDVQGTAASCTDDAASQQLLKAMYPRMSAEKAAEQVMIEVRL
jgi:deazaflavin-dependent oxidoreductase (nitroreductase family)